jgi:formiminoglutamate deiminase
MYEVSERLNPDTYYQLARAVYGEMVLAGITTVGEFHYVHHQPGGTPYDNPNVMGEALMAAARDAGIRITLLDTCYLSGGFGDPLISPQKRFSDGSVEGWQRRFDRIEVTGDARLGAAIHSVRAVDPESIAAIADFAADIPLHAHVSEQPAENERCEAETGMSPVEVFERAGALDRAFTAVHATHVSETDIGHLGSSESSVCFCPTTERDLADGIGPSDRLRAAGISLCLGSDSQAVIDPFEEARAVELNHRLATGVRGTHKAVSLLRAATVNGQRSLGWSECEGIQPGEMADFIAIDRNSVRMAGSRPAGALAAAVFAATSEDVQTVIVGGEVIVSAGEHTGYSVAEALTSSLAML